ncbi:hypothetical protein MNV_660002 [Candidatus Methanoperedens nitroreducens]|uniref:Uncharacterized protein n=1 Tax=Candidatus Methanoperedens nitratireducens TaxID=1392998 RepID=A0A284VSK1_9EURY|nr:hypothetical protein MNV_660002 [Candidatus Methanoperedens nitroreducens]
MLSFGQPPISGNATHAKPGFRECTISETQINPKIFQSVITIAEIEFYDYEYYTCY